ncbi:GerMN domain-containing protein [Bariatricus massiliensis]|uniref:GerMN domain-containing protein n=1 Tax=Bariatricus massiliensis TaxID=1745713 RepID=A0ABS8DIU9_9FIRM|nr:GerMN domain-containing protein [Bariatricus massiliensis]MCB7305223.1 GerMN domain-containing protein [Bariatricus massiliensis]MCB7375884.1 GerMN domain-containing protein [Bariatricus massiliensis]MCB7388366.1 GerMN domain-containing protein [Bariatricus massiliensis]MCB7412646.1 GerMN domain-containing protein [Bariatricus massiliensis]MCQ5254716.1 GerMN domain-containing protein [Bariatricus massiliensis]
MKKKGIVCGIMLLLISLTSCGQQKNANNEVDKPQDSVVSEKDNEQETSKEEDEENGNNELNEPEHEVETESQGTISISVYYPHEESGELVSKSVAIEKLDAQLIWEELQKVGVVEDKTAVLGIEINSGNSTIDLDLNEAFGIQLRSMGTTGEKELLNSIVNTYLDAFQCDKIKLTEEGGVLASGHKEYEGYLGRE